MNFFLLWKLKSVSYVKAFEKPSQEICLQSIQSIFLLWNAFFWVDDYSINTGKQN